MPLSPHARIVAEIAPPDEDFARLERAEQLIVWTLRAIAIGHGDCPTLRRMFALTFGPEADDAFLGFFVTVRTLGWCGRRKLSLHAPGCMRVSADERAILALFTQTQAAMADGDETEVRLSLARLLDSGATEPVLLSLQAVAGALEVNGYTLPRPRPAPATRPRVLH
jgi:hypothetical protein